jgi:hypothetical protein
VVARGSKTHCIQVKATKKIAGHREVWYLETTPSVDLLPDHESICTFSFHTRLLLDCCHINATLPGITILLPVGFDRVTYICRKFFSRPVDPRIPSRRGLCRLHIPKTRDKRRRGFMVFRESTCSERTRTPKSQYEFFYSYIASHSWKGLCCLRL